MIYSCLYESDGTAVKLLRGTARALNLNARSGRVWREIDASIKRAQDAPSFATTTAHPEFEARAD